MRLTRLFSFTTIIRFVVLAFCHIFVFNVQYCFVSCVVMLSACYVVVLSIARVRLISPAERAIDANDALCMWVTDFDRSTRSTMKNTVSKYTISKISHPCVLVRCHRVENSVHLTTRWSSISIPGKNLIQFLGICSYVLVLVPPLVLLYRRCDLVVWIGSTAVSRRATPFWTHWES